MVHDSNASVMDCRKIITMILAQSRANKLKSFISPAFLVRLTAKDQKTAQP